MDENINRHIYGPVPSRRLGLSLGVSPIPKKTCNYSCVYCQLGRTDHLTNTKQIFFPVQDLLDELRQVLDKRPAHDIVTLVGEGEPTLYAGLGDLIRGVRRLTEKPVAVITNGALLHDPETRDALMAADMILPSLDACDELTFRRINRPVRSLKHEDILRGLIDFSREYSGLLWLEIMLVEGMNDSPGQLARFRELLDLIKYDRVYINTPVRPPAEPDVQAVSHETMNEAVRVLGGLSIELLLSQGFYSDETDHVKAIRRIILRHPMNQHEIRSFLLSRNCTDIDKVFSSLRQSRDITVIDYKGYDTYRFK